MIHPINKLGSRDKNTIFIRYSKHSKCHNFINENKSGNVTKFESRDVTFLENEFPKKGDVDQDLNLFEMEDKDDLLVQSQVGDIHENVLRSLDPNGNDNDEGGLVSLDH